MTAPTGQRPSDAADRLDYLRDTAALLWPGRTIETGPAGAGDGADSEEYLLLPDATRPRLIVPARPRRVAAAALLGHAAQSRGRERLTAGLAAVAVRSGLSRPLVPHRVRVTGKGPALGDHLSEVLGQAVQIALPLSPPRANRKPVLRLLDAGGRTVGFAKLGVDALTSRLVRAETVALLRLAQAGLPGVAIPRVLDRTEWNGRPLLVQSPVPTRRQRGAASLAAAMLDVAGLDSRPAQALNDSAYWAGLAGRVDALPRSSASAHLGVLMGLLRDTAGDLELATGSWHGDWTPWNCALRRRAVAVWDWERFATDVPLGFDALHYRLQAELVVARQDPASAASGCVDAAGMVLDPFDVPASVREVTALCYLIDLATRYTEDRQEAAGARLGRVSEWLLPTVDTRVKGLRR